jgi:hypothetical protein
MGHGIPFPSLRSNTWWDISRSHHHWRVAIHVELGTIDNSAHVALFVVRERHHGPIFQETEAAALRESLPNVTNDLVGKQQRLLLELMQECQNIVWRRSWRNSLDGMPIQARQDFTRARHDFLKANREEQEKRLWGDDDDDESAISQQWPAKRREA